MTFAVRKGHSRRRCGAAARARVCLLRWDCQPPPVVISCAANLLAQSPTAVRSTVQNQLLRSRMADQSADLLQGPTEPLCACLQYSTPAENRLSPSITAEAGTPGTGTAMAAFVRSHRRGRMRLCLRGDMAHDLGTLSVEASQNLTVDGGGGGELADSRLYPVQRPTSRQPTLLGAIRSRRWQ
eukprot:COSAG01_NODE_1060_length_11890_cov_17.763973_6_plen_183_part_00